ncbi:methyltransferase domain-containing protein [Patescibacteria group bacterium]|nr:methyltransferase domain-containing protein [Patescibacteria group bacterium]
MIIRIARRLYGVAALLSPIRYVKLIKLKKIKPLKLNIGCGKVKYPGWVNIDIEPDADLVIDIRKGLPFRDDSVDYIYCEHLLEHFSYEEGERILREFRRCLQGKGIARIGMPDLDYVVQKYNTDWENQDWLHWPEHEFIKTRGQMINVSFRRWGHKYLYNEEDLRIQLNKARFTNVIRCKLNESSHAELCNLETRKDTKLVMEAEKQ